MHFFPVDRLFCRVDNKSVHSHDSFDLTTFRCGPSSELMRCIFPLDNSVCPVDTTCPFVRLVKRIFRLVSSRPYWTRVEQKSGNVELGESKRVGRTECQTILCFSHICTSEPSYLYRPLWGVPHPIHASIFFHICTSGIYMFPILFYSRKFNVKKACNLTLNMLSPDYSGIWRNVHSTTCDVTNLHVSRFLGYATNAG